MKYKILEEIIEQRRSIRKFKETRVSRETIEKIINIGMNAPSAFNSQLWEMIVIDDKELKNKINDYLVEGIGSVKTSKGFVQAPVLIIMYGDERTRSHGPSGKKDNDSWWDFSFNVSLSNAFMSMQLACSSLGLGSMWVSAYRNPLVENKVRKLLNIPDEMRVFEMMAIGYPDIKIARKKMRNLNNIVHYNGDSNYRSTKELDHWF